MSNDTPGRQGGGRDERDDASTPDPGGLSWDDVLTGRTPAAGTPAVHVPSVPPPSASSAEPDEADADPLAFITGQIAVQQTPGTAGQPLTRREARQAAEAAQTTGTRPSTGPTPTTGTTGTQPVAVQPSGSRAQRRSARSDTYPERERRGRRGAVGCLVVILVLAALLVGGWFALQGPIQQFIASTQGPADYEGSGTGDVMFAIVDGDIGADIAQNLHEQGVTASFDAFYDLLLAQDPSPVFQPGAYALHEKMSAKAALAALEDPASRLENTVVVPEGTAAADVYQLISDATKIPLADVQAAAADVGSFGLPGQATTLEGFLFPATYTFNPGVTAPEALKTMVDRSFQALDEAGVAPEQRWDTIRLASLVQKEAGLRDDYYKVSRVFLNRLDQGWKLQSDATVGYGTGNTHVVTTTDAERADANNLYNTYVHDGLPIGPISNPGDLAIDAALHPADGPWMFFVTWNLDTGETIFSETVEQHEAAVEKWLAWMDQHPEYGG